MHTNESLLILGQITYSISETKAVSTQNKYGYLVCFSTESQIENKTKLNKIIKQLNFAGIPSLLLEMSEQMNYFQNETSLFHVLCVHTTRSCK